LKIKLFEWERRGEERRGEERRGDNKIIIYKILN